MKKIEVLEITPPELEALIDNSLKRALLEVKAQESLAHKSDRLLNIQEVAQLLSLSVQTIYVRSSKNEIPCMKKGKRLYFYESEILEWVKKGKRKDVFETEMEIDAYLMGQKKGGKR